MRAFHSTGIFMLPNNWRYLRGDIYYADMEPHIGSEQGGTRPVVVLQNDVGNTHSPTLIVATLTSKTEKKAAQPTHCLVEPEKLKVNLNIEYVAMEIPNDFIVGYGLDYDGFGRNYPDIYTVVD